MYNQFVVGTITPFSGTTTPDKNGELAVMVQCVGGKMPNRNVLSGTVAKRAGFEVGKTYLINVREQGVDKLFGTDYTFIKVKELETGKDIIETAAALGAPEIFVVERPKGFEDLYDRKSSKVLSQRTERIKSGDYQTSYESTVANSETAKEVIEGTSLDTEGFQQAEHLKELLNRPDKELTPGERSLKKIWLKNHPEEQEGAQEE